MLNNSSIEEGIAISALEHVLDPEIGLSVIDLGLIYDLSFDRIKSELAVTMTLTTEMCPMGESIARNVESSLKQYFNDYSIIVNLVFEPKWSSDNISEKGKIILNS